ncbi:hypothetical protein [Roseateles sp. YR242]|nr:hypothetical protein [Roseateles sp. YR242]
MTTRHKQLQAEHRLALAALRQQGSNQRRIPALLEAQPGDHEQKAQAQFP